ncbi:MAG: hypothetical protein ABIT20_06465 [Gemmatimonadaceae bacterium]
MTARDRTPGALVIALLLGVTTFFLGVKLSDEAGAVARSFTLPSGDSTPYDAPRLRAAGSSCGGSSSNTHGREKPLRLA